MYLREFAEAAEREGDVDGRYTKVYARDLTWEAHGAQEEMFPGLGDDVGAVQGDILVAKLAPGALCGPLSTSARSRCLQLCSESTGLAVFRVSCSLWTCLCLSPRQALHCGAAAGAAATTAVAGLWYLCSADLDCASVRISV